MTAATKLLVKNMVCPRCVASVEKVFEDLSIPVKQVALGEVEPQNPLEAQQREALRNALAQAGFELIENRTHQTVSNIKQAIGQYLESDRLVTLSAFIKQRVPMDYSYLSDLFSSIEGRSIEQYFIELRIEKVKELIVYDQLSLTEIAYRVGFSSVHHLSSQFKKVTGLTPSHFKKIGGRKSIDQL